jgi:dTDP-4-amino-4,6-dideoxygalactose transaminase
MRKIPFNKPYVAAGSENYLCQAVANMHFSGDGPFTKKCHALLEQVLGVPKVLLTTSCTHALEMAALLLDIKPDDEVIVPSFTFVSTINAFVLRGAKPVFIDIRPDTLNLDEKQLERLITKKTKAIVPVHYGGISCEMDTILKIASGYGVPVVEDNAHGLFGLYKGRYLGTLGSLATQSFHETKNFSCGEGGALLINEPKFAERAEIIREKGTNRNRFFRGMVDKYTWVDVGSSFLPSDILAALLYAQIEQHEQIQEKRKSIWNLYLTRLADWAKENQIDLPHVPEDCTPAYHLFYLLMPSLEARTKFIAILKAQQITSVFHYLPLHLSEMGLKFGGADGNCPVTESYSDRLVRLPFYNDLTFEDQMKVVDACLSISFSDLHHKHVRPIWKKYVA